MCRPYAEAIADLLDPQGGLFHRVIANSASTDKDGMPVDQLKSFSRVRDFLFYLPLCTQDVPTGSLQGSTPGLLRRW